MTETIPPPSAAAQKLSRYRSVRRAQESQTPQLDPFPQHESPAAAPPVPPVPAMPAMPEVQPHNDAPISRSKSRYHRRPTVSHATAPSAPPPSAYPPLPPQSPPAQPPSSTARSRAASSPHAPHAANSGQHRPRTSRQRADDSPPVSSAPRQQSLRSDDSAKQLMQRERERQRLLKDKYDAEAREQRHAKQAELDRREQVRLDEEEAVRMKAQQDIEHAEALRQQKEALKTERERGKRLQKAEAREVLHQREEEVRRAKTEERERRARHDHSPRKAPSSSPPISPPRHDVGFGLFKRRKDEALNLDAPASASSPPRLDLSFDREPETIRPGGGGAVLGIDAPNSAVNAGDRVCVPFAVKNHTLTFLTARDSRV